MSRVRENRMPGSTGGSWKRSDWSGSPKWDNPTGNRGHQGFWTYRQNHATAPAPDPTHRWRAPGRTFPMSTRSGQRRGETDPWTPLISYSPPAEVARMFGVDPTTVSGGRAAGRLGFIRTPAATTDSADRDRCPAHRARPRRTLSTGPCATPRSVRVEDRPGEREPPRADQQDPPVGTDRQSSAEARPMTGSGGVMWPSNGDRRRPSLPAPAQSLTRTPYQCPQQGVWTSDRYFRPSSVRA